MVEALIQVLGDDEIYRFAFDMKAQLVACSGNFVTTSESLASKAATIKAGFHCWKAARMSATFDIRFPETMIKKSNKAEDATHEGWAFTPSFSSIKIFEGNIDHSTRATLLRKLRNNKIMHQSAIDEEFPPDQSQHMRMNLIFSDILGRGYDQAVGFLNSLIPFYNLLSGAGVSDKVAWDDKMLTYVTAVWERIHSVRTITSEQSPAAMIFGMMKATDLLDEYGKLDWIHHSDVAAAMVITSLQRDGKGNAKANTKLTEHATAIVNNKDGWMAVRDRLKKLEQKNPTWNS